METISTKILLIAMFALLGLSNIASAQWEWQNPKTQGNTLNAVYFIDANTGYAVGDAGIILKTDDAGASWTTKISGTNNHLQSVYFANVNIGYVVGYNGTILKTIDSGNNWTSLNCGTVFDL